MSLSRVMSFPFLALAFMALAGCSSGGSSGGGAATGSSTSSSGQVAFEVSGLPSSVVAGTASTFAVIARDGNGNLATTYSGTVVFTSTDPLATLPAAFTYTSTDRGTHFFQGGLTFRSAGARTISVSDQAFPQVTGAKTVSVTAGAAASLSLSLAANEAAAITFSAGTLSAVDAFGNAVAFDASADPVTVSATPAGGTITGLGSASSATLDRASDFVSGVATLGGKMVFTTTPGAYTFSAQSATGKTSNAVAVTIFSAPVATTALEVQGFTSQIAAGDATTIVVIARDQNGAIATGYAGTVTFTSNDPVGVVPSSYTFTPADSGVRVFANGVTLKTAGARTIQVSDAQAGLTGLRSITVTAGALEAFSVELPATHQREDAFASGTVTAVDAFGNTVTSFSAASDPVVISVAPDDGVVLGLGGAAGDALDQAGDFVQGRASLAGRLRYSGAIGVHTFTAAIGSGESGTSAAVDIGGVQLSYSLSGLPTSTQAGTANQLLVAVRDNFGALVTGYVGTVTFTSNDPQATLPATVAFTSADTGVKLFSGVVLKTAGTRTITARDTIDPTIVGTASATVTTAPHVGFTFTLPETQRQGLAFPASATLTARDAFGNAVAFNASLDPVSITASPSGGAIAGLSGSGSSLNGSGSFPSGVASLSSMVFSGPEGSYAFQARSNGGIEGTSAPVFIENPIVFGAAQFTDVNFNGICDAGDTLVVPFGTPVTRFTPVADDLRLFASGDTFGNGATVGAGPSTSTVRVTLGALASLRTRGAFSASLTGPGAPSGIDVFPGQDGIRVTRDGSPVLPSAPIDIVAGWIAGGSITGGMGGVVCFHPAAADLDADGDVDLLVGGATQFQTWTNTGGAHFVRANVAGSGAYTANAARGCAIADLDEDGDPDAVGIIDGAAPRLFEGVPGTGLSERSLGGLASGLPGSPQFRSVALADIDADGDPDVVFGLGGGQGVRVYTNSGAFAFAALSVPALLTTGDVTVVLTGDLNGDGNPDIAVGAADQAIRIFINDFANTSFVDAQSPVSASGTASMALGDVDRDGDLDIVEGRADGLRVHRNNGLGTFTTTLAGVAGAPGMRVSLADLDRDGDLDVAVAYASGTNQSRVLYGDGLGGFTDVGVRLGADAAVAVLTADLERDGDPDIFTADGTTGAIAYLGSVAGTFGRPLGFAFTNQTLLASPQVQAAVALDIDDDGDLDVASVSEGVINQGLKIYRNNAGTFVPVTQGFSAISARTLAAGDYDNDGDTDIAIGTASIAGGFGNTIVLYENNGTGTFAQASSSATFGVTSGGVAGMAFVDYDRDGDLDLLCAAFSDTPRVYPNSPRGSFALASRFDLSVGGSSGQARGVVLLGLGRKDQEGAVILSSAGDSRFFLLDTNGTVQGAIDLDTHSALSAAVGDIDRDGRPDLIVGNMDGAATQYFRLASGVRNESISFAAPINLPSAASLDTVAVALGDLDGDGDLDLVQCGSSTHETRVLLNGAGAFTDSLLSLAHSGTGTADDEGAVVILDIDRDGDLDIVTGANHNNAGVGLRVFRNQ